jgi:hypothetical protein
MALRENGVSASRANGARGWRDVPAAAICCVSLRGGLLMAAWLRTGTRVLTQGDTASYLTPGRSLFLHGVYWSGGLPEIDRTPGYPIFLMCCGMLRDRAVLAAGAQIVLSVVALLLVRALAARVFESERAGTAAGWLYAVEPVSIVYSVRLMPETMFTVLLLASLERLASYFRSGRLLSLVMAAIALAAATYVRPVSYYLGFALALGLMATARRVNGNWWKAPAVFLLAFFPLVAVWQARNWLETGYWGFSSIVEKNLYFYQAAEVTAELEHLALGEEQRRLGYPDEASYAAAHPEQAGWGQAQRLRFMRAQVARVLAGHRVLYLKTHVAGVGVVAFTPCASEWMQLLGVNPQDAAMPKRMLNEGVAGSVERVLRSDAGVAAWMAVLEAILVGLYVAAAAGLVRGRGDVRLKMALAGVGLYFLLVSGGAQAVGRYRLPVMPEVCIFAAGGLTLRRKQMRGLSGPASSA